MFIENAVYGVVWTMSVARLRLVPQEASLRTPTTVIPDGALARRSGMPRWWSTDPSLEIPGSLALRAPRNDRKNKPLPRSRDIWRGSIMAGEGAASGCRQFDRGLRLFADRGRKRRNSG